MLILKTATKHTNNDYTVDGIYGKTGYEKHVYDWKG